MALPKVIHPKEHTHRLKNRVGERRPTHRCSEKSYRHRQTRVFIYGIWYCKGRGEQVRDDRRHGKRKQSGREVGHPKTVGGRGGQGCDCTGGNRRETEAFQGGIGLSITRFSTIAPAASIEMRDHFCSYPCG